MRQTGNSVSIYCMIVKAAQCNHTLTTDDLDISTTLTSGFWAGREHRLMDANNQQEQQGYGAMG